LVQKYRSYVQNNEQTKFYFQFIKTSARFYPLNLGRRFSPGTPASSTTKTGCHDIAEILLKVALKHQKSNQILAVAYILVYKP
jgi:hypothetical protein